MTARIFSYGGGVQSNAVLVLQAQGKIEPYDALVFANVGDDSEHPATLRYVHEVAMPFAEKRGIRLVEVQRIWQRSSVFPAGTRADLYRTITHPDLAGDKIPVRMNDTGKPSGRACTYDFKFSVIKKWCLERFESPIVKGIGFSVDKKNAHINSSMKSGKCRSSHYSRRVCAALIVSILSVMLDCPCHHRHPAGSAHFIPSRLGNGCAVKNPIYSGVRLNWSDSSTSVQLDLGMTLYGCALRYARSTRL